MIQFKNGHFRDAAHPVTLEDSIRLTGAFAGVHKYDFEDLIEEPFDNLDDWTPDAAGTYVISSNRLSITGGGAAIYYRIWHDATVDPSFVASFDLVSGPGQVVFLGNDSKQSFSAWWTPSATGFSEIAAGGGQTLLISHPEGISGPARIQLSVKYSLDTNEDIKWLQGTLFADGKCIVGFTKDIGGAEYDWTGSRFALSAADVQTVIIDNLTISSFSRIIEWTSIDIGDGAASGMARAVGSTRLARLARYDNTARVWRPGNRDEDWALPAERPVKAAYRDERAEAVTHVRTRGVLYQVDVFSDPENRNHLHRFLMTDDPNLFTKDETYAEALKVLHNETEKQRTVQLDMPPNPALEMHDRISYDGEDWRILGIQRGLVVSGSAVVPKATINAQRYIEQ